MGLHSKSFAKALQALRTLQLLEQHHQKLSQLIKIDLAPKVKKEQEVQPPKREEQPSSRPKPDAADRSSSPYRNIPTLQRAPRELSSSIASNLASARGIPSSQRRASAIVTAQHARGHNSPERRSLDRREVAQESEKREEPEKSDEPFTKFYSTFENLVSKITAPLAFAGLPLKEPEEDPDLKRIISRAALRAVREERGNPAESFYVVPSTGGTVSYAGIVGRDDGQPRDYEELKLKNQALQELTDNLSRKLHMWEMNAQSMQQSVKVQKDVEEELDKLRKDNEKLRALLNRYRKKWEELKAGARQRREA